jgi:hypothetical protein
MKTPYVEKLVRAAVAQSVKGCLPQTIPRTITLRALGYTESDVLELTTRLLGASSERSLERSQPARVMGLTLESTLSDAIERLSAALAPMSEFPDKDEPTQMKRQSQVEAAVCEVLAETTSNFNFLEIEPGMTLGRNLSLDEVAIAQVKIKLFKTLSSHQSRFPDFIASIQVGEESTVGTLIEQVDDALPMAGKNVFEGVQVDQAYVGKVSYNQKLDVLAGDDDTEIK